MLLAPAQAWVRRLHKWWWITGARKGWTRQEFLANKAELTAMYWASDEDLDSRWWWKPMWGCYACVAGQWGFWFYLIHSLRFRPHFDASAYVLRDHLYFTSLTLILAALWRGLYAWSQRQQ